MFCIFEEAHEFRDSFWSDNSWGWYGYLPEAILEFLCILVSRRIIERLIATQHAGATGTTICYDSLLGFQPWWGFCEETVTKWYIVFINSAPIYWLSKKQTSCETSTFGSDFLPWNKQRNTPVGFDTSSGCLEFQLLNLHFSMGIISRFCVTRLRCIQHWRRNKIQLPFTLWGRDVHKMSG